MSLALTAQGNGLQLRGLGRAAPQQAQITGTLAGQFDLALIDAKRVATRLQRTARAVMHRRGQRQGRCARTGTGAAPVVRSAT